ncbi:hypothetical protein LINGRAHAP2_LOCUS2620 [Linum grandiflorum]
MLLSSLTLSVAVYMSCTSTSTTVAASLRNSASSGQEWRYSQRTGTTTHTALSLTRRTRKVSM